jgi:hypothetical protein
MIMKMNAKSIDNQESRYNKSMQIKQINVIEKSVVIEYMSKERLVTFNDNGDIDVEPFNDLSEEEGQELFDRIINNAAINVVFVFED